MKAHRLNLREAAMPSMELALIDGTVVHVLPGSPSQLKELQAIYEKLLKEGQKENTDLKAYIKIVFEFLAELLSKNREGIYMTSNDLRNKYLKVDADPTSSSPEEDAQQDQLLVITAVINEYVSFLDDLKNLKNS